MEQFETRLIPVPADLFDELGIDENTVLESFINDDGALVIRALKDIGNFICDSECGGCPVNDTDCDGECFECPCFADCEDAEGFCKSHGDRRDEDF